MPREQDTSNLQKEAQKAGAQTEEQPSLRERLAAKLPGGKVKELVGRVRGEPPRSAWKDIAGATKQGSSTEEPLNARPLVPEPPMPPTGRHNLADRDIRYHSGGQQATQPDKEEGHASGQEEAVQTPAEKAVQDYYETAKKDSPAYEVLADEVQLREQAAATTLAQNRRYAENTPENIQAVKEQERKQKELSDEIQRKAEKTEYGNERRKLMELQQQAIAAYKTTSGEGSPYERAYKLFADTQQALQKRDEESSAKVATDIPQAEARPPSTQDAQIDQPQDHSGGQQPEQQTITPEKRDEMTMGELLLSIDNGKSNNPDDLITYFRLQANQLRGLVQRNTLMNRPAESARLYYEKWTKEADAYQALADGPPEGRKAFCDQKVAEYRSRADRYGTFGGQTNLGENLNNKMRDQNTELANNWKEYGDIVSPPQAE